MGLSFPVLERAVESAGIPLVGRRTCARADRAPDAGTRRLLLLDEPTNDLDIPTLEILEESLAGVFRRAGAGDA